MLRPVVHIYPSDILHQRDQKDIGHKDQDTDDAFNDCQKRLISDKPLQITGNKIGQHHKNAHRKDYCHYRCQHHQNTFRFILKHLIQHLVGCAFLCPLLFRIESGGMIQAFRAQSQGIRKRKDTADKRKLCQFTSPQKTGIFPDLHIDLPVRLSHRNRITGIIFHHNPFQDRLTADTGITFFLSGHGYTPIKKIMSFTHITRSASQSRKFRALSRGINRNKQKKVEDNLSPTPS